MRKPLVRNISETNRAYLEAYKASFTNNSSWNQYNCTLSRFLEFLGETDLIKIKWEKVEEFISQAGNEETTGKNKIAHISAFIRFVVKNNLGNAKFHINKSVLFELL
jgi:site-specific recombinase XerD